jgi:hypothetical protein
MSDKTMNRIPAGSTKNRPKHSLNRRERTLAKTNGRCWYCGRVPKSGDPMEKLCIDHVVPRIHGGSNTDDNLVPACRQCNVIKGDRSLEKFRVLMAWKIEGVTIFDDSQIAWLEEHGIVAPMPDRYVFYGERIANHE